MGKPWTWDDFGFVEGLPPEIDPSRFEKKTRFLGEGAVHEL